MLRPTKDPNNGEKSDVKSPHSESPSRKISNSVNGQMAVRDLTRTEIDTSGKPGVKKLVFIRGLPEDEVRLRPIHHRENERRSSEK
jgi:hypothetical protein